MLARFLRVSHNRTAAFEPVSAIFPGDVAPVVRLSADGECEIVLMSWGFVLLQKERAPRRVTNVRDDKILESRFWRGSFEERRRDPARYRYREPPSIIVGLIYVALLVGVPLIIVIWGFATGRLPVR